VVRPEAMGLLEQIALFRSASHVIGEYGSAIHSTVFGPPGMRVGFIRCPNAVQLRISALCGQSSIVMLPEDDRVGPTGVQEYSLSEAELASFFAALDA
jgi:capsular polysaccharide biosynthesis protein